MSAQPHALATAQPHAPATVVGSRWKTYLQSNHERFGAVCMSEEKIIHESGEDYLEAVLMLQRENGNARSVDVAKKLGVSRPSVSRAMSILTESGYITANESGALELTAKGKKLAQKVYERHLLLTQFLVKITGVASKKAEETACRIEHDIDEEITKGIQKWMRENA